MVNAATVAELYIELWNETDAGRRARILDAGWDQSATYVDPVMRAAGTPEIDGLIGAVHARFAGYRFKLIAPGNGFGDFVRFSWTLGPADGEAPLQGSDVIVMKDGRIHRVIGFLDKVPQ